MIIVRSFDRARDPLETDRVSFPIALALVDLPGVQDVLELRARNWFADGWLADKNADGCLAALRLMRASLTRLSSEEPNRQQRQRDFRDEFLAHNLDFQIERARPVIADIGGMLDELTQLSDYAELAFNGASTDWEPFEEDTRRRADQLWTLIRRGVQS